MGKEYEMEYSLLNRLGIKNINSGACYGEWIALPSGGNLISFNPSTEKPIASVIEAGIYDYRRVVSEAEKAFLTWSMVPAPKRGEIIRQLGEELRKYKKELGILVSLEMGKILAESEGEGQEMIDICDF